MTPIAHHIERGRLLADALENAESRIEKLEKDAMRYRFIRIKGIEHEVETGIGMMVECTHGEEFDTAIDNAMKESQL
jgi:hypothetical protein